MFIFEKTGFVTNIDDNSTTTIPAEFSLKQNYPNPFNPITTIQFTLSQFSLVDLKVYDPLGQEVVTLINKELRPGEHSINFDAKDISSGVYFYRIRVESSSKSSRQVFVQSKKLVLLK